MTETENVLLQLTVRALFGASTDFDPSAVDWKELYKEASNQALTLLIWDTLTKEERAIIPKEISTRWEQTAFVHIMNNENLRYEQEQVLKALEDVGISCVILKGSSSAACYPKPELRIMGDIDLLVKPEEQMDAVKILQAQGYGEVLDEDHHCHMAIHKDKFTVEVHREPNGLFVDAQSECAKKVKVYLDDAVDHRQLEHGLPVLPDDMQALTLLIHKLEHFLTSGLGLRQLCDWAVFVDKRMDEKLWAELEPKLKEFGLLYFTGIMTKACMDYLGLPPDSAPWAMEYDSTTAGQVMEQILKEGNFGRKADRYGERLFANPSSSNRVTSFFKVLFSACREHWRPCDELPILLPIGPFVLLGRYLYQRRHGERPKLNLRKKYQQAGNDQKLYQSLRPFVTDWYE